MYYPEFKSDCRTAAIKSGVEALERKQFLKEIVVDVADERFDFLDNGHGLCLVKSAVFLVKYKNFLIELKKEIVMSPKVKHRQPITNKSV